MACMNQTSEIFSDHLLGFTIPARDARGRLVRLDGVLDMILSAHSYPPAITHLLAEALVLTTLIGGLIKEDDGQMTMQTQTDGGVVKLLACDFRNGELRGYVDFDADRLAALGANPTLYALFGKSYLAITIDREGGQGRYQGIVPLEGDSLSSACESYFFQSEQVPTLIRVGIQSASSGCIAGGLLVQHLPDGEEGRERLHTRLDHPEWEHIQIIGGSIRHEEMVDRDLSLEALVWRLFHEEPEIRIQSGATVSRGCRCSVEHYRAVLAKFPEADRAEMRDEAGIIAVDCAFCSRIFPISV